MKDHKKIKIIFLLPSLVPGGAERVISFVAQNIDKETFDPLLLIAGNERDSSYDVSKVTVKYLNKSRILTAIPSIITTIIKEKPLIVVSSIAHVNKAMSAISPFFKTTKFIGREATVLSERKNETKKSTWSLVQLLPSGFKNLDMLICQSRDMAEDLMLNYDVPEYKITVINNPISHLPRLKNNKPIAQNKRRFITVGRLTEVKGYLRILDILSQLEIPFEYTIIGEGHLKDKIFEKAKILGLFQNIKHIPFTDKVYDYIAKNDMYLQGSYVEGFPNALLESCVMGIPVVAFNGPGGTKEIIEQGVNGFLVETEEEFRGKLIEEHTWDSNLIKSSVIKKFNKEKIIKQYEDLFINILN